jgi:FkbM family methyltransferase
MMTQNGSQSASDGLDWLKKHLPFPPHRPRETESLSALRASLADIKRAVVFGAGSGGQRTYRVLREQGVEVDHFIDNFVSGEINGLPVFTPQNAPDGDWPILLASTWFVDVYQQLTTQYPRYSRRTIIPVPDCAFLTMTIFDDMVGWPFYKTFAKRNADFQNVFTLWEDHASQQVFARILAYRLGFFAPGSLNSAEFPCPPKIYDQAARPVPALPTGLEEGVVRAIESTFAHPHYILDNYMSPQPKDVVFDGGAWEGDTAYWYAHHCGPDGLVYAFEPSPYNYDRLRHNITLMNDVAPIIPVRKGLTNAQGIAPWDDMTAAGTCSRISATGGDGTQIELTTIDAFVEDENIERLDIIKMDLEGADFDALVGAKKTIAQFLPDLAISIYHTADHLVDIPLWIHKHFPQYRLRLSHNHVGVNETICMATVRGNG